MKPMQNDDINVYEPKRKFRFIHLLTKKIVRAETKSDAIVNFKRNYNIDAKRVDVRQAYIEE